ncbi:MAG: CopG family transcriptional regulator [Actinomycetia bacterium]|nr:CopG family transcriptional regulator [Actinomycetes bacterium]
MARRIPMLFRDAERDRLRRVAPRYRVSPAAVVGDAVHRDLLAVERPGRATLHARTWAVVGVFASGSADGSAAHDRHLSDACQT